MWESLQDAPPWYADSLQRKAMETLWVQEKLGPLP